MQYLIPVRGQRYAGIITNDNARERVRATRQMELFAFRSLRSRRRLALTSAARGEAAGMGGPPGDTFARLDEANHCCRSAKRLGLVIDSDIAKEHTYGVCRPCFSKVFLAGCKLD